MIRIQSWVKFHPKCGKNRVEDKEATFEYMLKVFAILFSINMVLLFLKCICGG